MNKQSGPKTTAKGLSVRYVKKAKMWVATYPKEGKTVQKWFEKEPTKEELKELYE